MIRVTLTDGKIIPNYSAQLHFMIAEYGIKNIAKIEKLVSELTINEMNKLWATNITDNHAHIEAINVHSEGSKRYDLNDYIDITRLYKE